MLLDYRLLTARGSDQSRERKRALPADGTTSSGQNTRLGLLVIGDLDCKVPTLKASGFAPRFGCQTIQGQSVDFARLHSMIS